MQLGSGTLKNSKTLIQNSLSKIMENCVLAVYPHVIEPGLVVLNHLITRTFILHDS